MVKGKTLAWWGIALALISGWKEIVAFINSILEGFKGILDTIPPLIKIGLIIWLFWWLGNRK